MNRWRYPFHMLAHPFAGLNELKANRRGLVRVAVAMLAAYFLSELLLRKGTSFSFNPQGEERVNVLLVFAVTVLPVLLFVLSNWCLCTLMAGEARLSDVFVAVCFTLLPLTLMNLFITLVSNGLTLDEQAFITLFQIVRTVWFGAYLFVAVMIVQQYTFLKTVGSLCLTVAGMAVILFLAVLVFSLFQQLYIFLGTIYNELSFRL